VLLFFCFIAVSLLSSADRPLSLSSHRPFLSEIPPEGVNLGQTLANDTPFQTYRNEIRQIVESSFQVAEKFLERFYPLGRIFEYSLKWDIEKYKKKHGIDSIPQIRTDLKHLQQWMADIVRMNVCFFLWEKDRTGVNFFVYLILWCVSSYSGE
jgi:hypothetical protein